MSQPTSHSAHRHLRLALGFVGAVALVSPGIGVIEPGVGLAVAPTVTLAGDLQSELGCSEDWAPACPRTRMTDPDGDGIFTLTATVGEGSWQFKAALNDSWDESYGVDGGNGTIALEAPARLEFSFNSTTKRLSVSAPDLKGAYDDADDALVAPPVREGTGEVFYFVLSDRFANGDTSNDEGGLSGDRLVTGFDPSDKGFYHGGDLRGIIDHLDYIESMGATAIWLTPSFQNRAVQGDGADASAGYHGYWVTDFTKIDEHLGGNEALAALRDAAHARGMKLYLDIITNHTADLIDYAEGVYDYVDTATKPYVDASGNPVDIAALANRDDFPQIAGSAYTPVRPAGSTVVPEVLNDVNLYHNRGNSTWSGESTTLGDFVGLDDLMTESPVVERAFEKVYTDWMDFGVDGFRIDTVKHVNKEFWVKWTDAIQAHANATNPDFFTFGEVYDADPKKLSPYPRDTAMGATLDFAFQSSVVDYAKGSTAKSLSTLFAGDDMYTTDHSSASAMPTFLGNHDMGRVGYLLGDGAGSAELQSRDRLAHSIMFLTRGQPVVYYGDEQGFTGNAPGNDKDARQDMFATSVTDVIGQPLVDGTAFGTGDHFGNDGALFGHIRALAGLRTNSPALKNGAQIELYAEDGPGVYVAARVDRDEKIEHLVAFNNSNEERRATLTTLTPGAQYAPVFGGGDTVIADEGGALTLTVPAQGALVLRADRILAPGAGQISMDAAAGTGVSGSMVEVSATATPNRWAETSFAYRPLGTQEWRGLGTAEDSTPRVFADLSTLANGTALEVRAVSTDAAGTRSAASTLLIVGNDLSGTVAENTPGAEDGLVTVPGNFNAAMGCPSDWMPDCTRAALAKDAESGIYTKDFDLPAGSWEFKVAIGGSWAENYGAGGVADGPNLHFDLDRPTTVTFFYDTSSHRLWTSQDGPTITLPGDEQTALGCTRGANGGNWAPDCLAPLMVPQGDGTWRYSTTKLPAGSYQVKVAHGLSWDENYGVDGVRDGPNYSFSVKADEEVVFTYTLATHRLEIAQAEPPLLGEGEQFAYWVDARTLAIPTALLPEGISADQAKAEDSGLRFSLVSAPDGGARIEDGALVGGTATPLTTIGDLPVGATDARPNLKGYLALSLEQTPDSARLRELLSGQLALEGAKGDEPFAFTGVQIAPVLDAVYAGAAKDASLGVTWDGERPSFALWAPTAKKATLLVWNTGTATGSTPELAGEARRIDATIGEDGIWRVDNADGAIAAGAQYLWELAVYVPATGAVEKNTVTDPYSVSLTRDSTRSVAVDPMRSDLAPEQWERTPAPIVSSNAARAIYELHVRDFSSKDQSVPEALRGTYKAFTVSDSAGMTHLSLLAEAGIDTVHLLPTFDIATIPENRADQKTPVIADDGPSSETQQAAVSEVADEDAFNWGYDPRHWMAPEGSYATEGHQDGGARITEFREMVGALHEAGLQVVLDQVFNHTAASGQDPKAMLDRIVPGYYQRLDATGKVTNSTCCSNVATENIMSEKLMIDSLVWWARAYRVDGFRFDLMGHHSRDTMVRAQQALSELTMDKDGVDGASMYLYGEGWNFGEVQNNALFTQATQGQLDGTGIGAFNDRLRDAVHGGGPFDEDHRVLQGFGSGQVTDPNGLDQRSPEEQSKDLAHRTDLVKLGLAGNLKTYEFVTSDGTIKSGSQIDYNGQPAGYASQPDESVNYVDAHDNETLFDLLTYKLPTTTSMDERVRMNTISLATVALGQSPSFWAAGTELLRSKSLDRDSFNSGDHFNAIDWTGTDNGFARGLPVKSKNGDKWPIMKPLLDDPALKPSPDDISAASAQALELLRLRRSTPLFALGSADLISQKVSFPGSGPHAEAGTLLMLIDDRSVGGIQSVAVSDVDPSLDGVLVAFNASTSSLTKTMDDLMGREFALSPIQSAGSDEVAKTARWDSATGTLTVPARTVAVFVEQARTAPLLEGYTIAYAPESAEPGETVSASPAFTDPEGMSVNAPEGLVFSLGEGAPSGAVIDAATGTITWTIPSDHVTADVMIPVTIDLPDGTRRETGFVVTVRAAAPDAIPAPPTGPNAQRSDNGGKGASSQQDGLALTGGGAAVLVLGAIAAGAFGAGLVGARRSRRRG